MRLLLDTHVAVWSVSDTSRLPHAAMDTIADGANEVFVSLVTLWEIAVKHGLPPSRRLNMGVEKAVHYFEQAPYKFLPLTIQHIGAVSTLADLHRDPFDRMLVAQALHESIALVTFDRALIGYHPLIVTF